MLHVHILKRQRKTEGVGASVNEWKIGMEVLFLSHKVDFEAKSIVKQHTLCKDKM